MATRPPRSAKLSRDSIVNAALTFLDRDGWDALTINALVLSDGQLRGAGMRFAPPDDITLRFGNSGEAALDFTLDHAPA